mmetsp:Transcript_27298/g.73870  ORF Transcript_27298/g.73870 Transcript_27298/m.73870 type:complete len:815 (+) Transcript_27298:299-2743(+)
MPPPPPQLSSCPPPLPPPSPPLRPPILPHSDTDGPKANIRPDSILLARARQRRAKAAADAASNGSGADAASAAAEGESSWFSAVGSIGSMLGLSGDVSSPEISEEERMSAGFGDPDRGFVKRVDSYSVQGERPYMEDEFSMRMSIEGNSGVAAVGVYDGHCGDRAAKFCRDRLLDTIIGDNVFASDAEAAVKNGLVAVTNEFSNFAKAAEWRDGTTAVVAVVQQDTLVVGNVGDSRAVLGRRLGGTDSTTNSDGRSRSGSFSNLMKLSPRSRRSSSSDRSTGGMAVRAIDMSRDHKPSAEYEKRRIKAAGGKIAKSVSEYNSSRLWKPWYKMSRNRKYMPDRVYPGGLSVSRTIGDMPVKSMAKGDVVSDKADLRTRKLTEEDVFLIMACDGLWDVVSSEEACKEVARAMGAGEDAAEALGIKAIKRGSMDNITVLVLYFDWEDFEELPSSATAKMLLEIEEERPSRVGNMGEKVANGPYPAAAPAADTSSAGAGDLDRLKRLHGIMKTGSSDHKDAKGKRGQSLPSKPRPPPMDMNQINDTTNHSRPTVHERVPSGILRQPSEKSLIRFPSSQKAVTFGHVEDNTGKISGGSWEAEKTYSPSVPEKGGARERAKSAGSPKPEGLFDIAKVLDLDEAFQGSSNTKKGKSPKKKLKKKSELDAGAAAAGGVMTQPTDAKTDKSINESPGRTNRRKLSKKKFVARAPNTPPPPIDVERIELPDPPQTIQPEHPRTPPRRDADDGEPALGSYQRTSSARKKRGSVAEGPSPGRSPYRPASNAGRSPYRPASNAGSSPGISERSSSPGIYARAYNLDV